MLLSQETVRWHHFHSFLKIAKLWRTFPKHLENSHNSDHDSHIWAISLNWRCSSEKKSAHAADEILWKWENIRKTNYMVGEDITEDKVNGKVWESLIKSQCHSWIIAYIKHRSKNRRRLWLMCTGASVCLSVRPSIRPSVCLFLFSLALSPFCFLCRCQTRMTTICSPPAPWHLEMGWETATGAQTHSHRHTQYIFGVERGRVEG